MVDYEYGKKEKRGAGGESGTFSAFLDLYKRADVYLVWDVAHKMLANLQLPWCITCGGAQAMAVKTVMWFSSGGTSSVIHNDDSENINCLFEGTKTLTMFNSSYRDTLEGGGCGWTFDGGYSAADVDRVDLERHPGFAGVESWRASMEPGDCLYIPHRWYHQVRSHGQRNLAVNVWFAHAPHFDEVDCAAARQQGRAPPALDTVHFFDEEEIREDDPALRSAEGAMFRRALKLARSSADGPGVARGEFLALVLEHGPQRANVPHTAVVEWIFGLLDVDGDGYASAAELELGLGPGSGGGGGGVDSAGAAEDSLESVKKYERWMQAVMAMCRLQSAARFEGGPPPAHQGQHGLHPPLVLLHRL